MERVLREFLRCGLRWCSECRRSVLVEAHAMSLELVRRLLAWRHCGFSAHAGEPIEPGNKPLPQETVYSTTQYHPEP